MSYESDYWSNSRRQPDVEIPDIEIIDHEIQRDRWTWRGCLRVLEHLTVCAALLWAGIIMVAFGQVVPGWATLMAAMIAFLVASLVKPQ